MATKKSSKLKISHQRSRWTGTHRGRYTIERKTVEPARAKRKLRKTNDAGKLKVVHVSSDFNTMILRLTGQTESKNKKSRRPRIDDILECEGGRLDP